MWKPSTAVLSQLRPPFLAMTETRNTARVAKRKSDLDGCKLDTSRRILQTTGSIFRDAVFTTTERRFLRRRRLYTIFQITAANIRSTLLQLHEIYETSGGMLLFHLVAISTRRPADESPQHKQHGQKGTNSKEIDDNNIESKFYAADKGSILFTKYWQCALIAIHPSIQHTVVVVGTTKNEDPTIEWLVALY